MPKQHKAVSRAGTNTAKRAPQKLILKNLKVASLPNVKPAVEINSDDQVEEYNFNEEDGEDMDDGDDGPGDLDDVQSVITVSSDPPVDSVFRLSDRPWQQFNPEQRVQWELMYANVTTAPMDGSWEVTEDYQRERDMEMLRYMEDHPLQTWLIPKQEADQAYFQFLERTRWRSLGIRIYGREPVPDWVPGIVGGDRMHQASPYLPGQDPRGHYVPPPGQIQRPSPVHVLPSQPHAQPVPIRYPTQIGRPTSVPQQTNGAMSPLSHVNTINMAQATALPVIHTYKPRKIKEKKETAPASPPPLPPPTPPYPEFKRPSEPNSTNKSGRKSLRRHAEAEGFPWTRNINFREAKEQAVWDDSIYDPTTIVQMEAIRTRNMPIIAQIDVKIVEQQRESMRLARAAKKRAAAMAAGEQLASPGQDPGRRKGGRKKEGTKPKPDGGSVGDPYHSGQFCYATPEEGTKMETLGAYTAGEIVDKTEAGDIALETSGDIKICWNPGKRALAENLEQVVFSVRDTVLTRRQLAGMLILTRRAAERIIDFCPDMLWRNLLLRIASEAGYGNKDVRDRFCWNGCYCDKATITKRISAALGQKQTQAKSKGYGPGELDWYNHNVKTFSHYIDFFGKRTGHRNWTKILSNLGEERKSDTGEEGTGHAGKTAGQGDEDEEDDNAAVDLSKTSSDHDTGEELDNDGAARKKTRILLEDADEEIDDSEESEEERVKSVSDSDAADEMDGEQD